MPLRMLLVRCFRERLTSWLHQYPACFSGRALERRAVVQEDTGVLQCRYVSGGIIPCSQQLRCVHHVSLTRSPIPLHSRASTMKPRRCMSAPFPSARKHSGQPPRYRDHAQQPGCVVGESGKGRQKCHGNTLRDVS